MEHSRRPPPPCTCPVGKGLLLPRMNEGLQAVAVEPFLLVQREAAAWGGQGLAWRELVVLWAPGAALGAEGEEAHPGPGTCPYAPCGGTSLCGCSALTVVSLHQEQAWSFVPFWYLGMHQLWCTPAGHHQWLPGPRPWPHWPVAVNPSECAAVLPPPLSGSALGGLSEAGWVGGYSAAIGCAG